MTQDNEYTQAHGWKMEMDDSDRYINELCQQYGYVHPLAIAARLEQWISRHGGEDAGTLVMGEAMRALRKQTSRQDRESATAHRHSIEGVIRFKRSDPLAQACICCQPGGGHIYYRGVEWDTWDTGYPEHFGDGPNTFVMRHITDINENEDKRVRLTIEVINTRAATQENSNG